MIGYAYGYVPTIFALYREVLKFCTVFRNCSFEQRCYVISRRASWRWKANSSNGALPDIFLGLVSCKLLVCPFLELYLSLTFRPRRSLKYIPYMRFSDTSTTLHYRTDLRNILPSVEKSKCTRELRERRTNAKWEKWATKRLT